jgi:TusA-related sulfurtransferase
MEEAHLDLRGTPCPLNSVRARLALEKVPEGGHLVLDLDAGEPERLVGEGLRGDGHGVERIEAGDPGSAGVRFRIRRG